MFLPAQALWVRALAVPGRSPPWAWARAAVLQMLPSALWDLPPPPGPAGDELEAEAWLQASPSFCAIRCVARLCVLGKWRLTFVTL